MPGPSKMAKHRIASHGDVDDGAEPANVLHDASCAQMTEHS